MKKLYVLILGLLSSAVLVAQHYKPVDEGSRVEFTIKNFGINVRGSFSGLQGAIVFNPQNLPDSRFDVSVDVNTVNTGINKRDNHLRKEEYFDVKKYPLLRFVSSKVTASASPETYMMAGKITIKGTVKEISFPFTAKPKNGGYLFSGAFQLNRRDFKVGGSSMVLSDMVNVSLEVFSKRISF